MADPLVTQADVEARFPPLVVRQLFSDDGSSTPGPRLAAALDEASRQGEALLLAAWPLESIALLVQNDSAVKGAICRLVIAIGADGKPEWSGDGAPYQTLEKKARAWLQDLATAAIGSRGEEQAGANTVQLARLQNDRSPPNFMFAATKGNPRAGGGF